MKRLVFWLLAIVLVLLTVDGAIAATYYDVPTQTMGSSGSFNQCVYVRFNGTETWSVFGITKHASTTATRGFYYNGSAAPDNAGNCATGNSSYLASCTFSGNNCFFDVNITANKGENWTIAIDNNGAAWNQNYGTAGQLPAYGNTSKVRWQGAGSNGGGPYYLDTTPRSITGIYFESVTTSVNTITISLSNIVNGSSWPSTVTFSNLTGNLSFSYFNITETGYCVTLTGNGTNTNCTTSGSGASTFFNVSNNSVSVTGTQSVSAGTYQALLNVSAYRLFLNTSIATYNTTNGVFKNESGTLVYALNGSNNVKIDVAGNYSKNITCTVSSPLSTAACNATGIYDNLFTIGAKNRSSQGLSSFSVNVTQATLGGLLYASTTTTGNTTFALLQGYDYFFNIHADGYANDNETLAANASTNLYNFSLYTQDSVNISFYDEETNALLSGTTVSIDFISELSSFNTSTTTGHLFVDLLVPGDYTLRYSASGYDEKFYIFTLVDDTFTAINLTLLNSSSGTAVTITLKDTLDIPVVGAIVKVLRFNINTNTYQTVEILTTNFEGITVASLSLNDEFYKFMVEYNNEVVLTTEASQIYGTTLTLFVDLIGGSGFGNTFTRYDLSGSIAYLNTSASFRFNFNDATNTASQGCLVVYELSETKTVYNQSCSASSSGSITVGIDNSTGQSYQAVGTVTVGDNDYTVAQYLLNFGEVIPEDGSGLLMMFFMILVFVFAMAINIEVAIIAGSFVPMMFTAMGLSRLDYTTTMFIFAFGLVVAFIIGVVRR